MKRATGSSPNSRAGSINGAEDNPIPLTEVIDVCGINDVLWTLQCCTEPEKACRVSQILACDYAEHVLPIYEKQYPGDTRPRDAIALARRYTKGQATGEELAAAREAAGDAGDAKGATSAARAARDAASAASAATSAARDAARDAVWAASDARDAARAANTTEQTWQIQRFKELLSE